MPSWILADDEVDRVAHAQTIQLMGILTKPGGQLSQ